MQWCLKMSEISIHICLFLFLLKKYVSMARRYHKAVIEHITDINVAH